MDDSRRQAIESMHECPVESLARSEPNSRKNIQPIEDCPEQLALHKVRAEKAKHEQLMSGSDVDKQQVLKMAEALYKENMKQKKLTRSNRSPDLLGYIDIRNDRDDSTLIPNYDLSQILCSPTPTGPS